MPLNIGGNQRGQGGTLADGSVDDAVPSPVAEGRAPIDYPPQLATGLAQGLEALEEAANISTLTRARVIAVGDEVIIASEFSGTGVVGATIQVARPDDQRRSFYDGNTFQRIVDGETVNIRYEYVTSTQRTATVVETGQVTIEEIFPYYKGNDVLVVGETINGTGATQATLYDLNVNGRSFQPVTVQAQQFVVKSELEDYWVCRNLIGTEEGDEDVFIAKPWTLRATPFDGVDYNGVEYTYAFNGDTQERTAKILSNDCTQLEILIPRMVFDTDRIYAINVDSTGVTDTENNEITLLDINADSRYWTRFNV